MANDGNTDGDWRNDSVTHTELDTNAWWQLDLGSVEQVDHILIWNRTDCCGERLAPFHVFWSEAPLRSDEVDELKAIQKVLKMTIPVLSGRPWMGLEEKSHKPKGGQRPGGGGKPNGNGQRRRRRGPPRGKGRKAA